MLKKNYRKISIIAYLNILIIIILEFAHTKLMGISESLLFFILIIYGLINGWYVQRVLSKQRKFEMNLDDERAFSNHILETMSSGIMITDKEGVTTYANDSSKRIFSNECCINNKFENIFGIKN